jgi:hypothetical protein
LRSVAFRASGLVSAGALAFVLSGGAAATTQAPAAGPSETTARHGAEAAIGASDAAFGTFLDLLMRAESNGRSDAANPRSTALGPFQFIKSTFLDVMRRHFPADVAKLNETDILALRTDRGFARRAAAAFSRDNLDYLVDKGLQPTFGHLRLAFLLGPSGAARVMQAAPATPLHQVLESGVIGANPFMRGMTAGGLIARATRDVTPREPARTAPPPAAPVVAGTDPATPPAQPARVAETAPQPAPVAEATPQPAAQAEKPAPTADAKPRPARPAVAHAGRGSVRQSGRTAVIDVKCDYKLASCRRWVDEQVAKLSKVAAVSSRRGA